MIRHASAEQFTEPAEPRKPAGWPVFEADEIAATTAVLQSGKVNYWTGTECREFEKEFAEAAGCKYAVALTNGTVAIELALHALGIGAGDDVIVTPRTFIASASAIIVRGARPVFADVDRDSQNITAESIERVLTPKTRAVILVHLAGWPCEMDAIRDLAKRHQFKIIEDCAQCHGATYRGQPVGSLGDVAAFSFCQDKIMTTGGEGGMLTTNDRAIWAAAWEYKDHGKSYSAMHERQHPPGFRWVHESIGTNWRMIEIQAAIGRLQLKKLPSWTQARRANAARLNQTLQSFASMRLTPAPSHIGHACYKHYVFVRPERLASGWSRDRIMSELNSRGVACFSGSCSEIYLEKAFPDALRPEQRLPVAKELGETSLMFLVHPTLTAADMEFTCGHIQDVLQMATCVRAAAA